MSFALLPRVHFGQLQILTPRTTDNQLCLSSVSVEVIFLRCETLYMSELKCILLVFSDPFSSFSESLGIVNQDS